MIGHDVTGVTYLSTLILSHHHYWQEQDKNAISNIVKNEGPDVVTPNNSTIKVTNQVDLPLSKNVYGSTQCNGLARIERCIVDLDKTFMRQ